MTLASHLPGFFLDHADEEPFGPGVLRHLSFDEWRGYDDAFPYLDRNYLQNRPLFLVADGGESNDDLRGFISGPASLVHHALALRNPACPPRTSPMLSIGYLASGPLRAMVLGPMDREAVVWGIPGQEAEPVTAQEIRGARLVYGLLSRCPKEGPVAVLLSALEVSGRPDVDRLTGFCLGVAALEAALLPDQTDKLRDTFSRRVAAVGTDRREEFAHLAEHAYNLHGLRSEIVHGGVREKTLENLGLPSVHYVDAQLSRDIIRPVVIRLAALACSGVLPEQLSGLLDDAADSDAALETLSAQVREGMTLDG